MKIVAKIDTLARRSGGQGTSGGRGAFPSIGEVPMRFSLAESMCDPSHELPLAVAAEEAGWISLVIPDSIREAQM